MNFYTQDTDGSIIAFAGWKFDQDALETDREIISGRNGKLYFQGSEPPLPLSEARAERLSELDAAFRRAETVGWLQSSLGFPIDANERANRDTDGLIATMEATGTASTYFCDRDNVMREVTLADVRTMRLEIIAYGQRLYAAKWQLREHINALQSVEDLLAVEIKLES